MDRVGKDHVVDATEVIEFQFLNIHFTNMLYIIYVCYIYFCSY